MVFTWQRRETYRKGESSTYTSLLCDCLFSHIQNIDVTKHFQKNFVQGHSPSLLQWENRHVETWFPLHSYVPKDPGGRKKNPPTVRTEEKQGWLIAHTYRFSLFCLDPFPAGATSPYLAVGTVDECSFREQVLEEGWQVPGQRGDGQNLSHPARHINHGLMGEAHIKSSVAPFQPETGDREDKKSRLEVVDVGCRDV